MNEATPPTKSETEKSTADTKKIRAFFAGPWTFFKIITVVGIIVGLFFGIRGCIRGCKSDDFYRVAVLQELKGRRDHLAHVLVQRKLNVRIVPARFGFQYKGRIPDLFIDDETLMQDIQNLYAELEVGEGHAERLFNLLAEKDAPGLQVTSLEAAIKRVVKLADEVGPRIAEFVDSQWKTPPPDFTLEEQRKYYESVNISDASDETSQVWWTGK